ncbi:putative disease resistance protein RGA3 [Gastrolobium bilobum]|uniref:putative disease resistance protein RGA3 n=1 Tax=Gastrolobium bilobum TaxID=150636 RepID=UPI002AB31173|nr:putative disease resistance protein RGA3 [Gastrolobium bilobum]
MADSLLEFVIDNLKSFGQDQLATFTGVEGQIQKLTGYLTVINAILQDAEEMGMTSHGHAVKAWLQKLTDAAHVLDDILDHCSIQSNRLHFEGQISRFHPRNILFRIDVGENVFPKFNDINEERRLFEFRAARIVETQNRPQVEERRQTISVTTEPKLYGRDQDIKLIVEFLLSHATNTEGLSIYPIVGMGGLGKTTLVQHVFNDERVATHFDLRIWIDQQDIKNEELGRRIQDLKRQIEQALDKKIQVLEKLYVGHIEREFKIWSDDSCEYA